MQKSCFHIRFSTPRQCLLDGLWYGGSKPRRAFVFVHGLGSNAFGHHDYLTALADRNTAVFFFSNRGHDLLSRTRRSGFDRTWKRKAVLAGAVSEIFADCVDDLQGAVNLLRQERVKDIYLVGHSTGCQKSVFYLAQSGRQKYVRGAVLLCPVSDYAAVRHFTDARKLQLAQDAARKLLRQRKPRAYLPPKIWRDLIDAQRFVSLYTPNGREELFPYAQPRKIPRALQRIHIPLRVVLAGDDEYHDRDTQEIAAWFSAHLRSKQGSVSIIAKAGHSFKGQEDRVANEVRAWIRGLSGR
jgi:pimeloyl-ACP methyl ester carboxylesterase